MHDAWLESTVPSERRTRLMHHWDWAISVHPSYENEQMIVLVLVVRSSALHSTDYSLQLHLLMVMWPAEDGWQ